MIKIIPTIKSVIALATKTLMSISDFFFCLLICLSPPYNYIITYGVRYVNTFCKKDEILSIDVISCDDVKKIDFFQVFFRILCAASIY